MLGTVEEMVEKIAAAANDKKARDVVALDMREMTIATDYFIIFSANTVTQVKAIIDHIEEELARQEIFFTHKEGYREGRWVLLDYGDCVVHAFTQEDRQFYNLERLWGDAPVKRFE